MANPTSRLGPRLATSNLPPVNEDMQSATMSPARGKEMRQTLLAKLRPPPLVHAWDFWFEKPSLPSPTPPPPTATTSSTQSTTSPPSNTYGSTLTHLHAIPDVRAFWSVANNLPLSKLPVRTSLHLFHATVKPVWEDARNARGGCWTFRVGPGLPKCEQFWNEVCLLAIGEQLQAAVEQPGRLTFRDDICGVSVRVRAGGVCLVQIWNRDAQHDEGKERILKVLQDGLSEGLMVPEGRRFYKAHAEHEGFQRVEAKGAPGEAVTAGGEGMGVIVEDRAELEEELDSAVQTHEEAQKSIRLMEAEVDKVRRILEEVKVSDEQMHARLAAEAERLEAQKQHTT